MDIGQNAPNSSEVNGTLRVQLWDAGPLPDALLDDVSMSVGTDYSPPSTPTLSGIDSTVSSIHFTANASDLRAGLYGFAVYINGTRQNGPDLDGLWRSSGSYAFSFWNLGPGTNYTVAVEAYDSVRNVSPVTSVVIQTRSICSSFGISPSGANPTYLAGSQVVTITGSPAGCLGGSWTASGNGSWITASPTSGSGSGSTTVSWTQNPSTSPRSGAATLAGNSFPVNQGELSPSAHLHQLLHQSQWGEPDVPGGIAGGHHHGLSGGVSGWELDGLGERLLDHRIADERQRLWLHDGVLDAEPVDISPVRHGHPRRQQLPRQPRRSPSAHLHQLLHQSRWGEPDVPGGIAGGHHHGLSGGVSGWELDGLGERLLDHRIADERQRLWLHDGILDAEPVDISPVRRGHPRRQQLPRQPRRSPSAHLHQLLHQSRWGEPDVPGGIAGGHHHGLSGGVPGWELDGLGERLLDHRIADERQRLWLHDGILDAEPVDISPVRRGHPRRQQLPRQPRRSPSAHLHQLLHQSQLGRTRRTWRDRRWSPSRALRRGARVGAGRPRGTAPGSPHRRRAAAALAPRRYPGRRTRRHLPVRRGHPRRQQLPRQPRRSPSAHLHQLLHQSRWGEPDVPGGIAGGHHHGLSGGVSGGSWTAAGKGCRQRLLPASGERAGSATVSWTQNTATSPGRNGGRCGTSFAVTQGRPSAHRPRSRPVQLGRARRAAGTR